MNPATLWEQAVSVAYLLSRLSHTEMSNKHLSSCCQYQHPHQYCSAPPIPDSWLDTVRPLNAPPGPTLVHPPTPGPAVWPASSRPLGPQALSRPAPAGRSPRWAQSAGLGLSAWRAHSVGLALDAGAGRGRPADALPARPGVGRPHCNTWGKEQEQGRCTGCGHGGGELASMQLVEQLVEEQEQGGCTGWAWWGGAGRRQCGLCSSLWKINKRT